MKIRTREIVLSAEFAALIVVGAFIKIPVPVVPFTLQFLFTNLAGLLFGRRIGALSVGIYLALGLVGLPVFAGGGGLMYVVTPTFGYLIGFLAGSWVAGYLSEQSDAPSQKRLLLSGFANLAIVYIFGLTYCYLITRYYLQAPVALSSLFLYGFLLAVPGDILLCLQSAVIARRLQPVLQRGHAS